MTRSIKSLLPESSRKIEALRRNLNLSQSELGGKIGTSAMAISRWERGQAEPPADAFIQLGNLTGDPLCWFFWGQAGLSTADVMRVLPKASRRLRKDRLPNVQVVHAGAERMRMSEKRVFVAVPLLPVRAATPGEEGDRVADLDQLKPEAMLAAPIDWCPNPASTVSLRVKGNSMSPLILDGYIIAVDTSDVYRDDLLGQIVVAWNIEKGLLVSRLARFDHTDVLLSDHPECESVVLAAESRWRIVGRVLWWIGLAR
jgi:phage repressor protein C with HTH and peptisase S24 domain/DNA-binding XRE family transcriptional regulator